MTEPVIGFLGKLIEFTKSNKFAAGVFICTFICILFYLTPDMFPDYICENRKWVNLTFFTCVFIDLFYVVPYLWNKCEPFRIVHQRSKQIKGLNAIQKGILNSFLSHNTIDLELNLRDADVADLLEKKILDRYISGNVDYICTHAKIKPWVIDLVKRNPRILK